MRSGGMGIWVRGIQSAVRSGGMESAAGLWRRGMSKMILPSSSIHPPTAPPIQAAPPRLPLLLTDAEAATLQSALGYTFEDRTILEDAVIHTSYPNRGPSCRTIPPSGRSYMPLKAMGEYTLKTRLTTQIFLQDDSVANDPDALCKLNFSPHKLARAAVRLGLYKFLRHDSPKLEREVQHFIKQQQGELPYCNDLIKVPDVLPHLVQSIFGAVTDDIGCNTMKAWKALRKHLRPIIYWEDHVQHAVTKLRDVCSSYDMKLVFKNTKAGNLTTTNAYINGRLHGSGTSTVEAKSKLIAAMEALNKLPNYMLLGTPHYTAFSPEDAILERSS